MTDTQAQETLERKYGIGRECAEEYIEMALKAPQGEVVYIAFPIVQAQITGIYCLKISRIGKRLLINEVN